jgi:hypothetical protein
LVRKRTNYSSDRGGAELILVWTERALTTKTQAATRDSAFAAGGTSAVMLIASAFAIDDGEERPVELRIETSIQRVTE